MVVFFQLAMKEFKESRWALPALASVTFSAARLLGPGSGGGASRSPRDRIFDLSYKLLTAPSIYTTMGEARFLYMDSFNWQPSKSLRIGSGCSLPSSRLFLLLLFF